MNWAKLNGQLRNRMWKWRARTYKVGDIKKGRHMPPLIIEKHLGHSDKRTTLVYLDHLADDSESEIISAMDNMMRD